MLATKIYAWVVLSVIVWVIATTIARSRVFRPLRRYVKARNDYFGEGISCQYCISHWVGFAVVLLLRPTFLPMLVENTVFNFFGHSFAVIGLGALIARTIGKTPPDGVLHPDEQAAREEAAQKEQATYVFTKDYSQSIR